MAWFERFLQEKLFPYPEGGVVKTRRVRIFAIFSKDDGWFWSGFIVWPLLFVRLGLWLVAWVVATATGYRFAVHPVIVVFAFVGSLVQGILLGQVLERRIRPIYVPVFEVIVCGVVLGCSFPIRKLKEGEAPENSLVIVNHHRNIPILLYLFIILGAVVPLAHGLSLLIRLWRGIEPYAQDYAPIVGRLRIGSEIQLVEVDYTEHPVADVGTVA